MVEVHHVVKDNTPEITEIRTTIHENPELSLKEYKTCALLEDYVKKNVNYDSLRRVGETGLVIEIKGTKPGKGKTIAFRGDIDALPIQEDPSMKPCSKVPGVMHACGHDVHGTINCGAAKVLGQMKDQFSGRVLFFIQPGEEILNGSRLFLNDPFIDWDTIDDVAAVHCSCEIPAGTIGVRYGSVLASVDEVHIKVTGKGGHGAHCHTVKDPIVASSAIVSALQTIVSRETNPADSCVLSICSFQGGHTYNIIPDYVEMSGSVRSLNPKDRDRMEDSLKRVCKSVAEAYRCTAEVNYIRWVPPFVSEDEWVDRVIRAGKKVLGEDSVIMLPYPSMGGDDFALMKERKPGVFVRLGVRTPGGPYGSAHSPTWYVDPAALPVGVLTIVGIVADYFGFEV